MSVPTDEMPAIGVMGDQAIALTPEDAQRLAEMMERMAEEKAQKVRSLVQKLKSKCDEAVKNKRQLEQRWVDNERQYEGYPRLLTARTDVTSENAPKDPPRIHATRILTDRMEARLFDLLLPTNDHPWDMEPSPDAAQKSQVMQQTQQMQPGMPMVGMAPSTVQFAAQDDVDKRCDKMKRLIQDQLSQCNFPKAGRRMIRDGVRLGSGLLMGPFNCLHTKRKYGDGVQLDIQETLQPEIREGDPWRFYPDMTPTIEKAEYAFYLELMSRRELVEFAAYPEVDRKQVAALLKTKPALGELAVNLAYRNTNMNRVEPTDDRYAVWRYTGTLNQEEMEALGMLDPNSDEDQLQPLKMAEIWFCNEFILKSNFTRIDKDFRIPYYLFSPFPADDTMFGHGLPYLGRDSQRVLDAAWQIALHNASVSAGALTLYRAGALQPRKGGFILQGPAEFNVTDEDRALDDVVKQFVLDNNVEEVLVILDRAQKNLEAEMYAPEVLDGTESNVELPASGIAMIMNNANILLRRSAACADDDVFVPIVQRLYWWNMQYIAPERPDIAGDYDIVPLGQSVQLVKDIEIQHLQAAMQITDNPRWGRYVDDYPMLKTLFRLMGVRTDDFVLTQEEADAKAKAQGPSPEEQLKLAQAQAASAKAAKDNTETQLEVAKTQHEMTSAGETEDINRIMADLHIAEQETQSREKVALINAGATHNTNESHISATLHSNLTKAQMERLKTQTELTGKGMDAAMLAAELKVKKEKGEGV